MRIDLIANDARTQSAKEYLDRHHSVRSGILFSETDTPPDILLLPIPITRDGHTLSGTTYTLADCRQSLLHAKNPPLLLGYGPCPEALALSDYRDLSKDQTFVYENAALTAEGGMYLLENALCREGMSLSKTVAVILGYGRIAREMAARLSVFGAHVLIGARRQDAREAAQSTGYLPFDCIDATFFRERGRLLFMEKPHILINTVPSPTVLAGLENMPSPLLSLELSGKSDVLEACQALPYPTIDGKAIPTRFFSKTAGELLAEAILRLSSC